MLGLPRSCMAVTFLSSRTPQPPSVNPPNSHTVMFLQAAKRLGPLREASCSWTARGLHAPAAAAGKEAPPRSGGPAQPAKGGKASRKTERPKPSLGFQVSPCAGRSASREAQHWAKRQEAWPRAKCMATGCCCDTSLLSAAG